MNLTIVILDFGVRLYGGSELSHLCENTSHVPRMLATDAKKINKKPDEIFFMTDENFGGSV